MFTSDSDKLKKWDSQKYLEHALSMQRLEHFLSTQYSEHALSTQHSKRTFLELFSCIPCKPKNKRSPQRQFEAPSR